MKMNKNKTVLGGIIAALLVVFLGYSFFHVNSPSVEQAQGVQNTETSDSSVVNGVTTWVLRQDFKTGTTTLCSFPNPAGGATSTNATGVAVPTVGTATSSLISVSVAVTTATSSASTFDIATSTSPGATSTPAFTYATAIGPAQKYQNLFMISTANNATSSDKRLTSSMLVDQNVIGPAQFVNVQSATTTTGGLFMGGQCIAVFRSVTAI